MTMVPIFSVEAQWFYKYCFTLIFCVILFPVL